MVVAHLNGGSGLKKIGVGVTFMQGSKFSTLLLVGCHVFDETGNSRVAQPSQAALTYREILIFFEQVKEVYDEEALW